MVSWTRFAVSFLAETVVQRISGLHVRGDTVFVVGVVPAVVTGFVRAVQELLGGFVEVVVVLVGNNEFDRRGAPALHISGVVSTVLNNSGVSRLWSRGLCRGVSASAHGPQARSHGPRELAPSLSSPAYSLRASDQSEALAP